MGLAWFYQKRGKIFKDITVYILWINIVWGMQKLGIILEKKVSPKINMGKTSLKVDNFTKKVSKILFLNSVIKMIIHTWLLSNLLGWSWSREHLSWQQSLLHIFFVCCKAEPFNRKAAAIMCKNIIFSSKPGARKAQL